MHFYMGTISCMEHIKTVPDWNCKETWWLPEGSQIFHISHGRLQTTCEGHVHVEAYTRPRAHLVHKHTHTHPWNSKNLLKTHTHTHKNCTNQGGTFLHVCHNISNPSLIWQEKNLHVFSKQVCWKGFFFSSSSVALDAQLAPLLFFYILLKPLEGPKNVLVCVEENEIGRSVILLFLVCETWWVGVSAVVLTSSGAPLPGKKFPSS